MSSASSGSIPTPPSRYQPDGLRGKAAVTNWLDNLLGPAAAKPLHAQIPNEAEWPEEAEITATLSSGRFVQPMVPGVPVEHEDEGDRYATQPATTEAIIWPLLAAPQIIEAVIVEERRVRFGRRLGRFALNILRKVPDAWWPVGQPL